MTEHDTIRELLPLAASGALDAPDERLVAAHLAQCPACAASFEGWRELSGSLRRLPTPLAPPAMVERTRVAIRARLAAQAENRWHRNVMVFLVLFAWTVTLAGWPVFRLVAHGVASWIDPDLDRTWLALVSYTALTWLMGSVAAAMLALRHRREGRIA